MSIKDKLDTVVRSTFKLYQRVKLELEARAFEAWENLIKNDIEVQKWVGGNGVAIVITSPTGRAYPIDEGGYLPNSMGNLMGNTLGLGVP